MRRFNLVFLSCIYFVLHTNFVLCQENTKTEIIKDIGVTYKVTLPQHWMKTSDEGEFEKKNPESMLSVEVNSLPSAAQTNLWFRNAMFNDLKQIFSDPKKNALAGDKIQLISEEEDNFKNSEKSYMITYKRSYQIGDKTETQLTRDLLFIKDSLIYKVQFYIMAADQAIFDKEWPEIEAIIKSIEIIWRIDKIITSQSSGLFLRLWRSHNRSFTC